MKGNANRTKNQIKHSKWRGNSLEYDVQASLIGEFNDIYRTCERGYQRQYDLQSDAGTLVIECKNRAKFSWNELKKTFLNLKDVAPDGYDCFLIFHGNWQPVLVMYDNDILKSVVVQTFDDVFGVPFIKHESTRKKKVI